MALLLLALVLGLTISRVVYSAQPAFYIYNNSGYSCNVAYFAYDGNGSWNNPPATISNASLVQTGLIPKTYYKPGIYRVAVGPKLGDFYCSATVAVLAFSHQTSVLNHSGHCHFSTTTDGLAMTIDPANTLAAQTQLLGSVKV